MSEPLSKAIERAVNRFHLSSSQNVHTPETMSEIASAAITTDVEKESVKIGIDEDSVIIVDPHTSKVLSKKPKTEAYVQMMGATKAEHRFKRKLFEENLRSAQQHMRFSLFAAVLGFIVVLGGIVAMILGYSQAGMVTSSAGIVSELVSALFFNQARHFNKRLDNTLNHLLEAEGYFRAFAIAEQLPQGALRDQLFEAIVRRMIGIASEHSAGTGSSEEREQS
ncbi:hypothetical protein D6779_09755 [Candidatus Parcubacteria bacterium]|nr:MAG: hypothetical protein D6779_09755 [Candidatus Parcubacteria bacterium]